MKTTISYTTIETDSARARVSSYQPSDGVAEYQVVAECTDAELPYIEQVAQLESIVSLAAEQMREGSQCVFKRYYLSDVSNQGALLPASNCAVSNIGQPPLCGGKIGIWAYYQTDVDIRCMDAGLSIAQHGAYGHIWLGGLDADDMASEPATIALFEKYKSCLQHMGCSLINNCMRTWFYVHDIDVNYPGMVRGRNEVFKRNGLTPSTHFIASTGIEGDNQNPKASVTLDAYAVQGVQSAQVTYLKAATHLNATIDYGVAFERGTAIDYGDRRHVWISGTASINNSGEIMHQGDVEAQARRMIENIERLLQEASCGWDDVMHGIVYLRDIADYKRVNRLLGELLPSIPMIIVSSAVCRTGWLIEMECMAIKEIASDFPAL